MRATGGSADHWNATGHGFQRGAGIADALPAEKAAIYASLDLRLHYRPDQREVVATADPDRVLSRVGGGT